MAHPEIGRQQIKKIAAKIAEYGVMEIDAKMEGRFMGAVFAPSGGKSKSKTKASKALKKSKKPAPAEDKKKAEKA